MLVDLLTLIMLTCSVPSQGVLSKEEVLTCRSVALSCIADSGVEAQALIYCTGIAQSNLLKGGPSAQPTPQPTPVEKVRPRRDI